MDLEDTSIDQDMTGGIAGTGFLEAGIDPAMKKVYSPR
jgi:hypothetical protein